ncbi:glycosyltransferase family 4 protein [Candidatus Acetothermia bacterium]|nr:glycosyltransferase family 4 protein [Candidatus Acetothermia bacterium]MBI3643863.1 glycosyltransferase family 4 protein [Candidatus Acetothermia bacterium]
MKVCLYLEAESAVAKSGFRRAFQSHQQALRTAGVEVSTNPNDRDYELLHLHAFGPKSLYHLNRAKREGIKVVVHAHSVGAHDFRDSFTLSNWIAPVYERYLSFVYAQADAIFTPTPFAKKMLIQLGIEKPISVISNGVDSSQFKFSAEAREKYRRANNLSRFTVFGAGLVIPRKGIVDFVEMAKRSPQLDFIWYGHRWPKAFAYHPKMDRILEEHPGNVRLPGYVEHPSEAFCAGDVLFFPSHTETQGMVLLEAAALGRPIVVRDLPEFSDWLTHGVDCLKGKTLDEFGEHLLRLSEDRILYERLASAAREMVRNHFIESVGEQLKALYLSVLQNDSARETAAIHG